MSVLAIRSLAKAFGGVHAVDDVSFDVDKGEFLALIGPNGAGKSTLLKTIFGFLHPRAGRIVFDGHDVGHLPPHALKRHGIGYVPQGANVFPQLTVQENLQIGTWVFRRDKARVDGMLERAYAAFPRLKEKRRLRATVLSGGEAKMLSVAKELVTEPSLLLVDEPSAGLAPRIAEQVYERLREVQAAGVTILLVDQNITKAVEVSDYLYMLEMGRVRREGPRQAFADQLRDLIRDALLGA
jgi:ABC-type branched-subunit amino acid transport system ATPase component